LPESPVGGAAPRTLHNPVQKDTATFLETSDETGGARTLIEVAVATGGGNTPHRHRTYAERFEVLEGSLTVRVEDSVSRLGPGETAIAPAGSVHRFANETDALVAFRVELRPGHRGFERALQAGYGLAADGLVRKDGVPKNPYYTAVLLEWSESLPGALRLLEPALRMLARRARSKGIDRFLAERYCAW